MLRPPVAQERVEQRPDGLVRITLNMAYVSRRRLPKPPPRATSRVGLIHAGGYRPWAELLARTFAVDVLACPICQGRMKLLALVKDPASLSRHLAPVRGRANLTRSRPGPLVVCTTYSFP